MNMKMNGWIKFHRKELEWMEILSDQELRYYITSRAHAVWDKRNMYFGTFDSRTAVVKKEMLPNWSNGKINQVKNSLIKKGLYQKMSDYRLEITNADIFFGKSRENESIIQETEKNLHITENYLHNIESKKSDIYDSIKAISEEMKAPWRN